MCRAEGYGFSAVLVWNRVLISTILVWNIGYGLWMLVLNWVCFLEEATSSSLGDKTISLVMFTSTVYVPWRFVTRSGHALGLK